MVIHSLGYQLSYFGNAAFKGLSQMKVMLSEEREMILQHFLVVAMFIFQEFQISFRYRKTTEDVWSGGLVSIL